MTLVEFQQHLREGKTPVLGEVSGLTIKSDPDRKLYSTDLEWLVAGLRNTIFASDNGIDLVPLSIEDIRNGLPFRFIDAWSDNSLREGYLPTTPTSYLAISEKLKNWTVQKNRVTYRTMLTNHVDTICFLNTEFDTLEDNRLQAHISYGNVHREMLGQGITSSSLRVLISGIKNEIPRYGFQLKRIVTEVSDKNTASIKVLTNNGFKRDYSREITNSPIQMGGMSIPVSLEFEI